jgi:glutamine amidotransferase
VIAVIDYGAGNLRSIVNACKKVGAETEIVTKIGSPDAIILPGVGNFGDAMGKLKPIRQDLIDAIEGGTPFLGLCLGLQVLFEKSEEAPGVKGLGILNGSCKRFKESAGKVPHMGWNQVKKVGNSPLFNGVKDNENFYFVHSYYAPVVEETIGVCNYGVDFSAAVQKKNIFACQFHPERSGEAGLRVLNNFVREACK